MLSELRIMHFKVSILLPFFCCFLVSCTFVPNELDIAGRIMETHPDSALDILQRLKPEKYKSGFDRALYGLVLLQALEKNEELQVPHSQHILGHQFIVNQTDHLFYFSGFEERGGDFRTSFPDARILVNVLQSKPQIHAEGSVECSI